MDNTMQTLRYALKVNKGSYINLPNPIIEAIQCTAFVRMDGSRMYFESDGELLYLKLEGGYEYHFVESSGTVAYDMSGEEQHITMMSEGEKDILDNPLNKPVIDHMYIEHIDTVIGANAR